MTPSRDALAGAAPMGAARPIVAPAFMDRLRVQLTVVPSVEAALDVAVVVVRKGAAILFIRRERDPMKGYWELPGGKIEVGESAEEAARRELFEETGLRATDLRRVGAVTHAYPWATVRLTAFNAVVAGEPHTGSFWEPDRWFLPPVLIGTQRLLRELPL
ncbi:MAG: NUDIX domain-containing protein [Thermoplasmatota archaeon]